jgi:hypothetical protein
MGVEDSNEPTVLTSPSLSVILNPLGLTSTAIIYATPPLVPSRISPAFHTRYGVLRLTVVVVNGLRLCGVRQSMSDLVLMYGLLEHTT